MAEVGVESEMFSQGSIEIAGRLDVFLDQIPSLFVAVGARFDQHQIGIFHVAGEGIAHLLQ